MNQDIEMSIALDDETSSQLTDVATSAENHELIHRWMDDFAGNPVPSTWVPGATRQERVRLAALGGLANAMTAIVSKDRADSFVNAAARTPEVQSWLNSGPSPSAAALQAGLEILREGEDGLAALYSRAVTSSSRRRLGTFFTPALEVKWMIARWEEHHGSPSTVIDVGAGVGAFTSEAMRAWPEADIYGVDVNPITLGLLGLRLSALGSRFAGDSPGVRLVLEDYVEWATREWDTLRSGRLVLGNPPYTRLQLLPMAERQRLGLAANGLCGSRASLSALITAATLNLLEPADGLCLLLPAQWLEADYASQLRGWLWGARKRRVDLHLFESDLFSDAQVDAVALIVGPQQPDEQSFITSASAHGGEAVGSSGRTRQDRDQLSPDSWRRFFAASMSRKSEDAKQPLSAYATIRRGVATGANDFFVVSEETRNAFNLPDSALLPLVRKLADFPDEVVTDANLKMLDQSRRKHLLFASASETSDVEISAYVTAGEASNIHEGVLCQRRQKWYDLTSEVNIPDVIIGPASKTGFRFVNNHARVAITNNLYGLEWKTGVSEDARLRILDWVRSPEGQIELFSIARTQGGGLKKIEPKAINALLIPVSIVSDVLFVKSPQPKLQS